MILKDLWAVDRAAVGSVGRFFLDGARFLVVIVRDVLYGPVTLWAMGLVYTTLMSLVPLLAVAFSVLKAFGVQNKLEPFLLDLLLPLGPNGPLIAQRIVEFVNNMRVGVLGVVGLGLLMWTVMSLIQKIEQAFNYHLAGARSAQHAAPVQRIPERRDGRTGADRFGAGPDRLAHEHDGDAAARPDGAVRYHHRRSAGKARSLRPGLGLLHVPVPVPAEHPRPVGPCDTSAALSAAFSGRAVGWGFASFIVASTKYAAIYSGFAILILFMSWLYLNWLILLVGAEVSFYKQIPSAPFALCGHRYPERQADRADSRIDDGPDRCTLSTMTAGLDAERPGRTPRFDDPQGRRHADRPQEQGLSSGKPRTTRPPIFREGTWTASPWRMCTRLSGPMRGVAGSNIRSSATSRQLTGSYGRSTRRSTPARIADPQGSCAGSSAAERLRRAA